MSEATFRRAHEQDLPVLVAMLAVDALREQPEIVGETLDPVYVEAFRAIDADPSQELIVAELDGRVVGTCQLSFIRYLLYRGGLVGMIESVRVDGSLRNRGIGAAMMRDAIERARARGCARVQLTTNKKREAAHRFYRRLGFVASHEGMKLYLKNDD
jgi:GNAT superfamily N-acetyltransferase